MLRKIFLLLLIPVSSIQAQEKIFIESAANPSYFWIVEKDRDSAVYLQVPTAFIDPAAFQFIKKNNVTRLQAPRLVQFLLNLLPNNAIVSFESSTQANHYLRHFSGRLRLDPYAENLLFAGDASFKIRPALDSTSDAISFESVNMPRSYLKADKDLGIILAPFDPFDVELDRALYTFRIHTDLPITQVSTPTPPEPIEPTPSPIESSPESTTP